MDRNLKQKNQKSLNQPTANRGKRSTKSVKPVSLSRHMHKRLEFLRIVEHKHTGRLLHHRHTSHAVLLLLLLFLGLFLYASDSMARSMQLSDSQEVSAQVYRPDPTTGARITSPVNGATLYGQTTVEVSGTCLSDSFVVVRTNDHAVGTTVCTQAGIFVLTIQLEPGDNRLSAFNYDSLNQAGPDTGYITVHVVLGSDTVSFLDDSIPKNPSMLTGLDAVKCDGGDTVPAGGSLHVAVVCVPRLFTPNIEQNMTVKIWGGVAPYAVSVDFGGCEGDALHSVANAGRVKISFKCATPGNHFVKIRVTDRDGSEALVQTVLQVNGVTALPVAGIFDDFNAGVWFKTPIPLYLLAVGVTLGFWGGDIFARRYAPKERPLHHRAKHAR